MQGLKEAKEKGISLKTTSILMVIISVIIAVTLLFTGVRAFRSFKAMEKTTDNYIALTEAASELMSASDYLTEEVQCFTVMGDRKHMENYFTEANVTRRRDNALAVLEKEMPGSQALQELGESMAESVALMAREFYAMRLMLAAQGSDDIPEELKNVPLSDADSALGAEEKIKLAQQMVHDETYDSQKNRIRGNMAECLTALKNGTHGNQQAMEDRAFHDLVWMLVLVVIQTLGILVMMWITTHLGVNPVVRAVDHIKKDQKIPIVGATEFRYLAGTYNTMYNAYKKSIESLNYKASHDELTGAYNRAGYDLIRSSLDMKTTAMLLLDADVFKSVNDQFGHETGDRVLRRIATVLKSNFRSDDYICRIGGDEFVVFMVHLNMEPKQLIEHKVAQINGDLSSEADGVPPISLSVGVSYDPEGIDPDEMFRQADIALYNVKENGRNGCCFYTDRLRKS